MIRFTLVIGVAEPQHVIWAYTFLMSFACTFPTRTHVSFCAYHLVDSKYLLPVSGGYHYFYLFFLHSGGKLCSFIEDAVPIEMGKEL